MIHLRWRFLVSAFAAVLLSLPLALTAAAAAPLDNGDGTLTDPSSGLTWIADPAFAESVGVARWTTRAEAVALVRAMNAGLVEGFGRTDWRLPTARELSLIAPAGAGSSRRAAASRTGPGLVEVRPVSASALVAGLDGAAIVAVGSVQLARDVEVTGDVVANEGGAALAGWEVAIDRDARIDGDVAGDRVRLDRDVTVTGNVASNQLQAGKATIGSTSSPLALPVFSMLPPLAVSLPRDEAAPVSVGAGETLELAAEDYQDVFVAGGGTLILTGGVYQVAGVELAPGARLLFRAASEVRVRDRLAAGSGVEVGPEDGSGLDGGDAIFSVGGIDGADGVPGSLPRAVEIGARSTFRANLHAPDGSVRLHQQTAYEGAIVAGHVLVDRRAELTLASFWANRPPSADPQTVFTPGAVSIVLTLTGSDPEGGDLAFSIADPPDHGALSVPVPIVPPPVPGRDGGPDVQPAVESASVTYTPAGAGDVEDAFTFVVTDPFGSFGSAVVTINPPSAETAPPPDPGTVEAADLAATVRRDASAILTFVAGAPAGVDLTYALVAGSGPAHGTLGPIAAGAETPVRTASVSYTPDPGFVGSDGFAFEVCGTVAAAVVCDQAAYTIEVVAPPVETGGELARDHTVRAVEDRPLSIDLLSGLAQSQGEQGEASTVFGAVRVVGSAVGITQAAVGGNVADADGDGFGDNANALPGSAPVLVSAGAGQSGGAGSNGTVRIHLEFDVSGFAGFVSDLVSARVQLQTNRGSVDSLDTGFWLVGDDGNGTLEASDFERPAERLGVTMPVPATQAVGEQGSFSFAVLAALRAALAAGHDHLTIQGRVDESLAGPARGLQVYSTADGNFAAFRAPTLSFSTPPPLPPQLVITITSLPQTGTLFTASGQSITSVPTTISNPEVRYEPHAGFIGTDSFTYEVTDFSTTDVGTVTVIVEAADCRTSVDGCDDGR